MDTIEQNGATSVELNAAAFRARQGLSGRRSAAVPQTGDDRLPTDAEERETERYGDVTARGMVRFTGSVYDPRQPGYCLPAWHPRFKGGQR
jgi:hypothetical protein